jgi:hypothetical protein
MMMRGLGCSVPNNNLGKVITSAPHVVICLCWSDFMFLVLLFCAWIYSEKRCSKLTFNVIWI